MYPYLFATIAIMTMLTQGCSVKNIKTDNYYDNAIEDSSVNVKPKLWGKRE